jgi:Glycine zipper
MIRRLPTLLAAAALAFVPLAASAQVSPGTDLVGTMSGSIDSKSAVIGQQVVITNVHSLDNNITGATMYGHVCDVQAAGQGTPGKLQICIDKLNTRSGNTYVLDGRVVGAQVNTKSNALNEAGGAVAGMIIGNIIGKRVGTNMGGLLGAAGGYLYAKNARQNVTIPANTPVTVQVLKARRQARAR